MALLIAALAARGTSTIHAVEQIDRGYERLDERLGALGARIERVDHRVGARRLTKYERRSTNDE